jgi:translation elongation factor EF-G
MAFAIEAKAKGDEEKMGQAIRRLQEEDPTIDFHRDSETGEQILAGITQIHVEVIVDRMKERFGAEVELHSPHVPYREAIKGSAKAHARYKKQTGGRGQFATATSRSRRPGRDRARVRERHQGRRDPGRVHPGRRRRACARRCAPARSPAIRSRT